MTELPTAAYPSHLSDGSLATDPWPGFDLHPIRSTPEGSPIGGLAEREVEPGDVWRQRTHRARAASSAYSEHAPCWQKNVHTKACQSVFTRGCYTCVCVCLSECLCACVWGRRCVWQRQANHKRLTRKGGALAFTLSPSANSNCSGLFYTGSNTFPPLYHGVGKQQL